MTAPRHMSWENFRTTVMVSGQQRVHRVTDLPQIEFFSDGSANRIGGAFEARGITTVPEELKKLTFIRARILTRPGNPLLELSTSATGLFRQFYHFAVAIAERMLVDRLPASEAVGLELKCFTDLLAEKAILGFERQIGLLGELLFLERLVSRYGPPALSAWQGYLTDPHDFHLESIEFEVKTTVSPQRIHIINGMEQMLPCHGCSLFLVSILLGPPGAASGFSLAEKAENLSALFEPVPPLRDQYRQALEANDYRFEDAHQYGRRFTLRRPAGVVPVDNKFPSLTKKTIRDALGDDAIRIESLQYEVNVEGLEKEDGTAEFEAAISVQIPES